MSASAVQLNWSSVEFASTPITRVTQIAMSLGGELIGFAGDNNRYETIIANNINRPSVQITGGDVATLMDIGPGTAGTITGTQLDALGATGGSIVWTISNAVHGNSDNSGPWGNFATATASFRCYSADGATSPFAFTRS
jgi:hypothetical protein